MLAILRFLVRTLTRFHIEGMENLPVGQATLVVSNHLHTFDAPVMGVALPHHAYTLAAEKYQKHIFGIVLRMASVIFINRGLVDRAALRQAFNVLEDGMWLIVAVEGTRSSTGALAEGKNGAAYIATRADVPLVPVVVWGTEKIIPAWARLRRADVYVRYGPPFRLPTGHARADQLDAHTDHIMATLASMLPEEYRGLYRDHHSPEPKFSASSPDH